MDRKKKYVGKTYKFKTNGIQKMKKKYNPTYHYILNNVLQYKKYQKEFQKIIKIEETDERKVNQLLLRVMESTGKELELDNTKIYSYQRFNKQVMRKMNKIIKEEKRHHTKYNSEVINLYKLIGEKQYKEVRTIAFKKPKNFLEAIYLYTICED